MFKGIFGSKEEWKVEVVKPFEDLYLGLAGEEVVRKVPVGATGKASVSKKGTVCVTFDTLKDVPHDGPLKVYFEKEDPEDTNFKWVEKIKEATESKIKT
ncbi:hypothetical protein, partial [Lysinibacillus xylanilyticus]|uniref:hypothetical protein n=1 Tax=Lysinibacillus xylanilyticus TaxID=582475 RepID=UPI0036DABD39